MTPTPEPLHRLDVKLDALITLVAKSLYSDELTCIRELLANAMDALSKREHHATQPHPADGLRCEIWFDDHDRTLVVRDNGVGLTEVEMRDFLTSIGRSGTRQMREQLADPVLTRKLIGNFGIGILSAFIVGSKIQVHSRAVGSNIDDGRLFLCTANGEYEIKPSPREHIGTTVRVSVQKNEHVKLLREELGARTRAYAMLLPYPVEGQRGLPVYNIRSDQVPWRSHADARTFLMQHLRLPEPLLFFQIHREDLQLGGLIWVPADSSFVNTNGGADLYVKGMLVRQGAVGILPDKAVFLAAAIECHSLEPTASREDVKRDFAFDRFRAEVEQQVLAGLCGLATRPGELQQILLTHGRELKGLLMSETGLRPLTVAGRQTCLFDELARHIPFRRPQDTSPVITLADYEENVRRLVAAPKGGDGAARPAALAPEEVDRIYYTSTNSSTSIQIQSVLVQRGIQVLVLDEKRPDGQPSIDFLLVKRYAERARKELKAAEERADLFPRLEGDMYRRIEELFDRIAGPSAKESTIFPPGVRAFRFQASIF
ncbi:MAG: ATP-binding protein [Planctomycetes bacterium]|nr:ATP-binding protein [Planctomycetota bacterium]